MTADDLKALEAAKKAAKSPKRGKSWEDLIEEENELLRVQGDARIKRAHVAARWLRGRNKDGKFSKLIAIKGHAEPDFYGLCAGGRHVAFDAKRTGSDRLQLPDPRKPNEKWWHQVEALSEISAFGGIGFLYVLRDDMQNPFDRARYVFPVVGGHIANHDPRLDRSIKFRDVGEYEVCAGQAWIDVVAASLEWWP